MAGNALKLPNGWWTHQPQNFKDLYESDGSWPWEYGKPRCNSVSNRGRRCGKQSCYGTTNCKLHGGALHDMTGRYEDMIKSERLRDKYIRIRKDPELMDQKDDLALLRAFCELVVEKHTAIIEAEAGDIDESRLAAMSSQIERITRLVDAITKREQQQDAFIHIDEIGKALSKVVEIIGRHVKDPMAVAAIAQEITSIQVGRRSVEPNEVLQLPPAAEVDTPRAKETAIGAECE